MIKNTLHNIGVYSIFIWRVFSQPDKWGEFFRRYISEVIKLVIDSIPLVLIISLFIGAVCTIQMKLNIMSPLIPMYTVGLATREIILLEFSSSILCLILAGKVGSSITSEIGTMRVTEQIDALEIMGINSANFLVLPKIVAFVTFIPVLVILCMATSLFGGYLITILTGIVSPETYLYGIQTLFVEWYVWYALIKSLFFAFVISSVASYFGYHVTGGALQVGKASTNAVVTSSILILLLDVILTNIMLQ